jgi:PmbA protein
LATSGNVIAENGSNNVYFSIRNFSSKNSSGHSVCCSRSLKDIKIKEAVVEACRIAKLSENPAEGKEGIYDIIFEPLAFANLLENVGQAASIFSVETGFSWFTDKLNKKVADDSFTLYDDATTKNGVGSMKFDAEGVPVMKKPIIKNGVLKNYLHNTSTAIKYKTKSTANAGIISPEPLCLVVEKGNVNKSGMIGDIKHGLIITNVWYTRFQNYATGDFSTIPRDGILEIKNGKIAGAVKGIRISDNITRMLMNISAIENKLKWILGWEVNIPILTPSVLIKKAKITKSVE